MASVRSLDWTCLDQIGPPYSLARVTTAKQIPGAVYGEGLGGRRVFSLRARAMADNRARTEEVIAGLQLGLAVGSAIVNLYEIRDLMEYLWSQSRAKNVLVVVHEANLLSRPLEWWSTFDEVGRVHSVDLDEGTERRPAMPFHAIWEFATDRDLARAEEQVGHVLPRLHPDSPY